MKMLTKSTLLVVLSCVMISSFTLAGTGEKPRSMESTIDYLAFKLELREEQIPSFKEIMGIQGDKVREIRKNHRKEVRESMKAQKAETLQVLSTILDEEQLAAFDELMAHRKARAHHKKGGAQKNDDSE